MFFFGLVVLLPRLDVVDIHQRFFSKPLIPKTQSMFLGSSLDIVIKLILPDFLIRFINDSWRHIISGRVHLSLQYGPFSMIINTCVHIINKYLIQFNLIIKITISQMNNSPEKTPLLAIDLVNRIKTLPPSSKSPRKRSIDLHRYKQKDSNSPTLKKADDQTVKQLFNLFKQQGLNNVNGLLKFLELYRNDNTQHRQSRQNSSQPKYQSNNVNTDTLKQYPVNVVRCQNTQFSKIRGKSEERHRLSIMINNAKMGLNLLEDKINNFSNTSKGYKKDKFGKTSFQELMSQSENAQYLYDNVQSKYSDDIVQQTSSYQDPQQDQEKYLVMKQLQQLVEQNKQRDIQIRSLQNDIDKIKNYFEFKQQQKREKNILKNIEQLSSSPKTHFQYTPKDTKSTGTFNLSSPLQKSTNKINSLQKVEDYLKNSNTLTLNINSNEFQKQIDSVSDLREFAIHTQSQQQAQKAYQ